MFNLLKSNWTDVKGNVKWDIAKWSGAAVIGAATYILHKIGHVPDWTLGAAIFVLALVVFWWSGRTIPVKTGKQLAVQPANQTAVRAVGLENNIAVVEAVYKKNSGQFLQEIESHFQRVTAHFVDAPEREKFLIRTISSGALIVFHDNTWAGIFKSQYSLLQELNTQPAMTLDRVKLYYDSAAKSYPELYKSYTFEQWLAFMRQENIMLQDGNVIQITVRGRDFLRFVVQEGKSTKDKQF